MRYTALRGLLLSGVLVAMVGCELKDTADTSPQTTTPTGATYPSGGADCDVAIPAEAEVVAGSELYNSADAVAWVCDGGAVTHNGSDGRFFLENGAAATTNGTGAIVYLKSGASATVNGSGSVAYLEPGASVTSNGTGSTVYECAAITFDSTAVSGGC